MQIIKQQGLPNLPWIEEAAKFIGMREITGSRHNPTIIGWLAKLGAWWRDDETPWCGTFVAHCLSTSNRLIPKHWYRAKAYSNCGTNLTKPAYGCVATKSRSGGGHVFFVVGQLANGDLVGLGGNQGNQVSLARFKRADVDSYTWPSDATGAPRIPYSGRFDLPAYSNNLTQQTEA